MKEGGALVGGKGNEEGERGNGRGRGTSEY